MRLPCLALIASLPAAAPAQSVQPCDSGPRADTIMEPWEENTATFSGGRVRIAALDTIEPAAASFHLLILSPPFDELGGRQCRLVSLAPGTGFAAMHFSDLAASYDPATGLDITLPVAVHDPDGGISARRPLDVRINQASGEITAQLGG